jgi:HSP20 family protein
MLLARSRPLPARSLPSLFDEFDVQLRSLLNAPGAAWQPPLDVADAGDQYAVTVDLPGVRADDVTVHVEGDVLEISGQRVTVTEEDRNRFHRVERVSGSFSRRVRLPDVVDADAVTATYADGVLEVRVPKPAQVTPRRVQITTGRDA